MTMPRERPPGREPADTVREVKRSVNLPDAMIEWIREEAKAQGVTVAQYVREAVLARLLFDVAHRRGEHAREVQAAYRLAREAEPPPRRPSRPKGPGE